MARILVRTNSSWRWHFADMTDEPAPTIMATDVPLFCVVPGEVTMDKTDKPPYRVPLMAEIAAIRPNSYRVASTFAGCGGSSLGYRMAGFQVVWANEFVPIAGESYRANKSEQTILDTDDVRTITATRILDAAGLKAGELDVFDGSPPCQAFSTAGKREKGWGQDREYDHGAAQRNEELFFEYIRLLRDLQPKVFVAENVSGLVKGSAKGFFLEILAGLKACGYRVQARTLDAQWLGVPQRRKRVIFIGVRNDLGLDPVFPRPLPYRYLLRDALPWIVKAVFDPKGQFKGEDFTNGPSATVTTSSCNHFDIEAETDISRYAIGTEWDNVGEGGRGLGKGKKFFSLERPDVDLPVPTITAMIGQPSAASVVHPTEKRKFSVGELKRLCAFPDDFELIGSWSQQCERLGNAVPPVMMSHIAAAIRDSILDVASSNQAAA
jgi:DNA (cytosine-5)-methyltransferase 1